MLKAFDLTRVLTVALALGTLASAAAQEPDFPQAEIANGRIRARLYLPDPKAGYYRATRFDWSGVIASLEWKSHTYFGQWFVRHDPATNDAITGPVEEFLPTGAGLGYPDAKPGEAFVRVGVGAVKKPDEPAYRQFNTYEIVDNGTWKVNKAADSIEFVHILSDTRGYAYEYHKKVSLRADSLVLEHRLRNNGTKPIVTNVYQHNFYMLDNQPTSQDFVVRFPFAVTAKAALNGLAETRGKELVYLKELQARETAFTELTGYGTSARDYDIRVENHKTGAAVRQTSDRPISKLMFWSPRSTVCPEAYIDLSIDPGKESSWRITYEFYEVPKSVSKD